MTFPKLTAVEKLDDPLLEPTAGTEHLRPTNVQLGTLRADIQTGLLRSAMGEGITHAAVPLTEAFSLVEEVIRLRQIEYVATAVAIADIDGSGIGDLWPHFMHVVGVDGDAEHCPVCQPESDEGVTT